MVLCPIEAGAPHHEEFHDLAKGWGWRTLPPTGWDVHSIPGLLRGIGLIIWVIAPHDEGDAARDGEENAALSIVAGYAEAHPQVEVRVLRDSSARRVADIASKERTFSSLAELRKCFESLKAEWDERSGAGSTAAPRAAAEPERPKIDPLPLDDWANIPDRFIGRQLQLNDVADAVSGLLHRARTGQEPERGRAVKIVWVHGFGAMGKSWFLHRARLQAGPDIAASIVDWDSPQWRYPLTGEPRFVGDLCEPIAYRLVQTCGEASADPYWLAKAKVRAEAAQHQRLREQFECELAKVAGPERPNPTIRELLDHESVWDDDSDRRIPKVETWRRDFERYRNAFVSWCHETARDAAAAAIDPDGALVDGLRDALRAAARGKPLILLLDTGEVLSANLDAWLRRLLVPLCRDESPILIVIGNRLPPDVALPSGSREGWQVEIPRDRFRSVPFDELVRFSVDEIEAALGTLAKPITEQTDDVAERIHKITHGVPLAVRALLDLHEEGIEGSILDDLSDEEDEPLEDAAAVRKVVGEVANRLLYHLDPSRRPERERDFRDIVSLVILQRADAPLLKRLWPGAPIRRRLIVLGARYALLSGGDLHATVRDYLRRYWRDEANRPELFDEVLESVERAIESLPPMSDAAETDESAARRSMRMNILAWRSGDGSVPEIARALAIAMANERGTEDLAALLKELPLKAKNLQQIRGIWKALEGASPDKDGVVVWLRSVCETSGSWDSREKACLALVEGVARARWGMAPRESLSVLTALKTALDHFGLDELPQKKRVGEALSMVATGLNPYWSQERRWLPQTEEAYLLAIRLGASKARNWCDLGFLYANDLGRIEDAEKAYLNAIELDPKFASPHKNLGNLYQDQLARYEDAEKEYLKAIELDPKDALPHNALGELYQDHSDRYAEADDEYLKAIALDPKHAHAHGGLGGLYLDHLHRYEDAERAFLEDTRLEPESGGGHRGLVWLSVLVKHDLAAAEQHVREATRLEPDHPASPLVAIAVTTWTKGWDASRSLWPGWLEACPGWCVSQNRVRLIAVIRKTSELGGLPELAEMLGAVADRWWWKPWSQAITMISAGAEPTEATSDAGQRLYKELTADRENYEHPE